MNQEQQEKIDAAIGGAYFDFGGLLHKLCLEVAAAVGEPFAETEYNALMDGLHRLEKTLPSLIDDTARNIAYSFGKLPSQKGSTRANSGEPSEMLTPY